MRASEAADLIQRFLDGKQLYPQEWNDFVDGRRVEANVEPYRRRCGLLDPMVNHPGAPDLEALAELKQTILTLRAV
jgi:hypothetical protein